MSAAALIINKVVALDFLPTTISGISTVTTKIALKIGSRSKESSREILTEVLSALLEWRSEVRALLLEL